ncbi:hypothetical protein THII_2018 [Thioploca ingrica]|uniref:Contractile injection system tube protein N-terminal domain-containing protein n=1 Tax=Thioploca ingrica TaxID=40754 RepID=A0A090AMA8_9GAMM|nr:hypothetical protein THII_2018 [Thioploca ingrica]
MSGGFSNKPKILRGAFVEYGLSIPPLFVVFQLNPEQLNRSRSLNFSLPTAEASPTKANTPTTPPPPRQLCDFHRQEKDLGKIQQGQQVDIAEEKVDFELLLDATDKMNDGDAIAQQFGITPQLSTLELMTHPKNDTPFGAIADLIGKATGTQLAQRQPNPPMTLFIWGYQRVFPVNINSMNITETQFNPLLVPIRATVKVNLTLIEGKNPLYTYSHTVRGVTSLLNLANITDIANVVVPG